MTRVFARAATAAALALVSTHAFAAGGHGMDQAGQPGDPAAATRTVEVVMHDNYYEPEAIAVAPGETVIFSITNAGSLVHEFNIGTAEMHAAHMPEMQMMVDHGVLMPDHIDHNMADKMSDSMGHDMHHNVPNSALLEPGQSAELVWTFPEGGEVVIDFACTVPGHYDAGMMGSFSMGGGS